jgi:hypothetical protein
MYQQNILLLPVWLLNPWSLVIVGTIPTHIRMSACWMIGWGAINSEVGGDASVVIFLYIRIRNNLHIKQNKK